MNLFHVYYKKLTARSQDVSLLGSVSALLGWDRQTGIPRMACDFRATQMARISGLTHELEAAAEVGDWISACEDTLNAANDVERANVREWRRLFNRLVKLPASLVGEMARASSMAHSAWEEARAQSDFTLFAPHLREMVSLAWQASDYWGYETERYDALLEQYEPGMRAAGLATAFDHLCGALAELVAEGEGLSAKAPRLAGHFPIEEQRRLNRTVAEALGYNFDRGRVDTAVHPFCTALGPDDIRLTTRYDEGDFTSSLLGVLHEAGHGIYEQGLLMEDFGLPSGSAASLGIHESQSRLLENQIGRSRAFWDHWIPMVRECFPGCDLDAESLFRHVNHVERSFIRVESDPVTYDLHIALRFQIERALFSGKLEVGGIPSAWNSLHSKLFGAEIANDADGCLQDMHWAGGAFGYFPTYTLGNLNAAQLYEAAERNLPDLASSLAAGCYTPLVAWMGKHIHRPGSIYPPEELIRRATGLPPAPDAHLRFLKTRIAELGGGRISRGCKTHSSKPPDR